MDSYAPVWMCVGILLCFTALKTEAGSMKILNGVRMSSPNLINSTSTAVTSNRCALQCGDTNCIGVSWDSQTLTCQTFEGSTVQGLVMSSAVTWTTFYRVGLYTAYQRKTGSCPSDWIDQATVFGSCYKFATSNVNWDQAKAYCDALLPPYSKLAVIDSKQEDDYITSLQVSGAAANSYVWLGGKRESGWFVWVVQNSFPLTAENWSSGNPSSAAEECIDKLNSNYNYQWNDQPCTSTQRPLCEVDLLTNQTKLYYTL